MLISQLNIPLHAQTLPGVGSRVTRWCARLLTHAAISCDTNIVWFILTEIRKSGFCIRFETTSSHLSLSHHPHSPTLLERILRYIVCCCYYHYKTPMCSSKKTSTDLECVQIKKTSLRTVYLHFWLEQLVKMCWPVSANNSPGVEKGLLDSQGATILGTPVFYFLVKKWGTPCTACQPITKTPIEKKQAFTPKLNEARMRVFEMWAPSPSNPHRKFCFYIFWHVPNLFWNNFPFFPPSKTNMWFFCCFVSVFVCFESFTIQHTHHIRLILDTRAHDNNI